MFIMIAKHMMTTFETLPVKAISDIGGGHILLHQD